ncbi:Polyubiquitin 9 [Capsicum chinense]|nr:Polyubiquitin 9 [Capsicum chinense]
MASSSKRKRIADEAKKEEEVRGGGECEGDACRKVGIPVDKQKLSYQGKLLDDSRDLSSYNIGWHSIVYSGCYLH